MDKIDRLIIKAKKQKRATDLKLVFALICKSEKEPGKWEVRGNLWNGVPSGKSKWKFDVATCVCDSIEECEDALNQLSEEYPNNKDVTIIIDNLDLDGDDEIRMFITLGKLANDAQRTKLVNLLLDAEQTGITEDFSSYVLELIKIYRLQVIESIGYDSIDFSWMTTEQLRRMIDVFEGGDENGTKDELKTG